MDNTKENVLEVIGKSQDGGKLYPEKDDYSTFMVAKVDEHTNEFGNTNTDDVISDFNYMINQLKAAVTALTKEYDQDLYR